MIDMKKFYLTSLAALLLVSCGNTQHKNSNEEVEDTVSLNIDVPESKSIATMSEDECKEAVTDFFASHFGKLSKIKKWTDFGKWENNKAAAISGEVSAVVRAEKGTYTFDALLDEWGKVTSMQMNHKGTMDCYYNYANGVRLDDNVIKSTFKSGGVTLRTIALREAGIRYVTSRKMNKNQIMDFIVNQTDMKRSNYYFQLSENELEYAQYGGDEDSGLLSTYDGNGHFYNVTIDNDGKVTIVEKK